MKKILALMFMVGFAGHMVCADEFDDLATYKYGVSGAAEKAFNKVCVLKAEEKPAVEQKLIAVISNDSATEDGKACACRCLQIIGTEASVPALSGLLKEEPAATYARFVLERMTTSEAAKKALRDALGKASDEAKVGVVSSLGYMRDAEAVKAITSIAKKSEGTLANAALMALGQIADEKAADALLKMDVKDAAKQAHWDALIECAARTGGKTALSIYKKALASDSHQHRSAGLMGTCYVDSGKGADLVVSSLKGDDTVLINAALVALVEVTDEKLTGKVAASLSDMPAAAQARVITALGARGDKAALKSVTAMLKSEDKAVKEAALISVAKLGDAGSAKLLIGIEGVGEKEKIKAIVQMTDAGVDAALVSALDDTKTREMAIEAIVERNLKEAVPALMKIAKGSDSDSKKAVWSALAALTTEEGVPALVEAVKGIKDEKEISYGVSALKKAVAPIDNKAKVYELLAGSYDKSDDQLKIATLEIGAAVGSDQALELQKKALASGGELAKTAVRSMSSWPNINAADELLKVAKTSEDEVMQILALRGYIGIASSKMNLKPEQRMEIIKAAKPLAKRVDEKRAIFSGLRMVRNDAALEMVAGYLSDAEVKRDAEGAASDILRHVRKPTPAAEKVAAVLVKSENKRVREGAEHKIKEWAKQK